MGNLIEPLITCLDPDKQRKERERLGNKRSLGEGVVCQGDLAAIDQLRFKLPAVSMDTFPGLGFRAAEKTAAKGGEESRSSWPENSKQS